MKFFLLSLSSISVYCAILQSSYPTIVLLHRMAVVATSITELTILTRESCSSAPDPLFVEIFSIAVPYPSLFVLVAKELNVL